MRGDLLRHLVAFQHVLEGGDAEAELFRQPNQLQDFVGAVAVRVHQPLAFQDFHQCVQLQVASGRNQVSLASSAPALILLPLAAVLAGFDERLTDDVHHAHARGRVAAGRALGRGEIRPLGVFAQGEFDARRRALEQQSLGVGAPAQLDDGVFAADGVGAAVQDVGGGDAAGQVAVDVDVIGVEHVFNAGHGANGHAALVDAVGGDVGVGVDDAGDDVEAGGVNHGGAARNAHPPAHPRDLAVADEDGAVLDGALGHRQDGGVLNDGDAGGLPRRRRGLRSCRRCKQGGQRQGEESE